MIRGPGDTWIVLGERCLFINTIAKWRVTCVRPSLLEAVWALIAAVGGVIGSDAALLWHDNGGLMWDWVLGGQSMGEILHDVKEAGGQSVRQLANLIIPEQVQRPPQGYFTEPLAAAQN